MEKDVIGIMLQKENPGHRKRALQAAFPWTIPVLAGYMFMGVAFGLLLASKGYDWWWATFMSTVIYAGSMQFVAVGLLTTPLDILGTIFITFLVNARHVFYGISLLEKFRDMGKIKPYLIFALSDETYSLLCTAEPPEGVNKRWFYGFIAALNQSYWIIGSTLGCIIGSFLTFDIKGIDFVMTALFVVIFVEQWEKGKDHSAAFTGVGITALCLILFGSTIFLLPSMGGIVLVLTLLRGRLETRYHEIGHI